MDSGLLNFPDLKIPQVFELDDMFGFCQDNTRSGEREIRNQISQFNPNLGNSRYHSFNLLKSLTYDKIREIESRLELFCIRTNILFCESDV